MKRKHPAERWTVIEWMALILFGAFVVVAYTIKDPAEQIEIYIPAAIILGCWQIAGAIRHTLVDLRYDLCQAIRDNTAKERSREGKRNDE